MRAKSEFNLEKMPLEIKTDGVANIAGMSEEISLNFYTLQHVWAGRIVIYIDHSQYYIIDCTKSRVNFPTNLPATKEKIWTITKTRTSDSIRLQIHCNDVEVLNFVMSDTTCTYKWRPYSETWNRNVGIIYFDMYDTASDYYKSYQGKMAEFRLNLNNQESNIKNTKNTSVKNRNIVSLLFCNFQSKYENFL